MEKREVIFEFINLGNYAQVRAIDVATAIEIALTTPQNTSRQYMMQLAKNKLAYVLRKKGIIQ